MFDASFASSEKLSADDRTWGAVSHLAALIPIPGPNLLGPLVVWLARRDSSEFLDEQGRESVNFQLSMLLLFVAALPLVFIGIGILILWVLPLMNTIFVIWAAICVSRGEDFRYPFNIRFLGDPEVS